MKKILIFMLAVLSFGLVLFSPVAYADSTNFNIVFSGSEVTENDIEKDIKKRHYNPLVLRFKYKETETVAQFKERIRGDLSFLIYDALGRCVRAWEDLKCEMPDNPEYKDSVGFMDNVIYLGLKLKTEKGFLNNEPL